MSSYAWPGVRSQNRKVPLATDGSDDARAAVDMLLTWRLLPGDAITMLTVVPCGVLLDTGLRASETTRNAYVEQDADLIVLGSRDRSTIPQPSALPHDSWTANTDQLVPTCCRSPCVLLRRTREALSPLSG